MRICCSFAPYAIFQSRACIWTTIISAMRACCCFSPFWNQTIPFSLSHCAITTSRTRAFLFFATIFVMSFSLFHIESQSHPFNKWMYATTRFARKPLSSSSRTPTHNVEDKSFTSLHPHLHCLSLPLKLSTTIPARISARWFNSCTFMPAMRVSIPCSFRFRLSFASTLIMTVTVVFHSSIHIREDHHQTSVSAQHSCRANRLSERGCAIR